MIYADGKQFLLEGKKYCYAMFINSDGFLQQLHYGGKIKREDLGYLAETYPSVVPNHSINKDEAFDYWSSEYGFYAKGDYKDPTGIFERKDGASMSRLRYKGYCVEKGVPELKGLPHVRKGDETLVITLKDDFSDIEVDLYYTVCENSNVLTRNAVIRNVGKEPIMLKRAFSFRAELANGEYKLLRLAGRWGQERIPEIAPVAHGVTRLHSLRGSSSHQTNPFMGILKEGCGEEQGECYGVQLVYSGSFALTAEWSKYGALTLQGGINETGFCWELCGGESFVTPQALLTYSNTGMGGMSREIHDFLRERIVNPAYAFKHRPVVINNWEATYFNFDNEKLCHIIDEAAKLDGASNLRIFTQIVLPLMKPILIFVALSQFITPWMDFIFPRMILSSPEKKTLAIGLYDMINANTNNNFTTFAAGAILVAVPITILYVCLQKYLIQGVTAGANKS